MFLQRTGDLFDAAPVPILTISTEIDAQQLKFVFVGKSAASWHNTKPECLLMADACR
jgi:hypothetical protein